MLSIAENDLTPEQEFNLSVFNKVMVIYDEYKANHGNIGKTGNEKFRPIGGIVKASGSDFCCDVEMTAIRTLTDPERYFFHYVFESKDQKFIDNLIETMTIARYTSVRTRVSSKMGKAFQTRKIYPTHEYFTPTDTRRAKRKY